ncbi:hypothetical protein CDL15_Pgr026324 [Punica granatum]|uniref:Uncharacterized protein n=1 Tax=Punica granatum TaxID=22663 RepID=A0A218XXB5_PUNGR|nr:hypothetical protein CDL15_Pgr026324 [Punica granatum]
MNSDVVPASVILGFIACSASLVASVPCVDVLWFQLWCVSCVRVIVLLDVTVNSAMSFRWAVLNHACRRVVRATISVLNWSRWAKMGC